MKANLRMSGTLIAAATGLALMQGCFGPFAKKDGGGGGGGPAAISTGTGTGSTVATTPSPAAGVTPPATPAAPAGPAGPAAPTPAGGPSPTEGYGCLQGVVADGFTGQPIDLSKLTDPSGIYILDHGNKLKAQYITTDTNLVGQYYICNIPLDNTENGGYPIFGFLPGYLPFASSVSLKGARALNASTENATTTEVKFVDPLKVTNIQLFPVNNATLPLHVIVVNNGSPVQGALVDAEPQAAAGHWAFNGTFAAADDTYLLPTRVTTDANGLASFDQKTLSWGVRYNVSVTPPQNAEFGSATVGTTSFTYGVDSAPVAADKNSFELTVPLSNADSALQIVSCSLDFSNISGAGSISLIFNRDVQVVDPDVLQLGLSGNNQAVEPLDVLNNSASEQVIAATSPAGGASRMLTLQPNWQNGTQPKVPDASKPSGDSQNFDKDIVVFYPEANIHLRVVGDNSANAFVGLDTVNSIAPGCPKGGVNPPGTNTYRSPSPPAAGAKGLSVRFFQEIY